MVNPSQTPRRRRVEGRIAMFSTVSLAAANSNVLDELARSGSASDPTFFIWGVLGALIAGSLVTSYLVFGRSAQS